MAVNFTNVRLYMVFHRKFLSKIFHFNFQWIFLAKVCLPIFIQKLIFDRAWLDKKYFKKNLKPLSLSHTHIHATHTHIHATHTYFTHTHTHTYYTHTHTLHTHPHPPTHIHTHIHIHIHKQKKNWKNEEKRISFRVRSWQQRQINEIPSIFF